MFKEIVWNIAQKAPHQTRFCSILILRDPWLSFWRKSNKYVSETKYLKYQQNIEGNNSFRMWNAKIF